jgi:phospholipase D-like protein
MIGILGLLILILDIYTIYQIIIRPNKQEMKLLWIILVVLLPVVGPLLYFVLGQGQL